MCNRQGKGFFKRVSAGRTIAARWLTLRAIACGLVLHAGLSSPAPAFAEDYEVRITQIDRSSFPKVELYVSITDADGNPVSPTESLRMLVYEDEEQVFDSGSGPPQTRTEVSTVLVLDISGSMEGVKLQEAKEAAITYIRSCPPHYSSAVVTFEGSVEIVADFSADRSVQESRIRALQDRGGTALQDGVGAAADLLSGRSGRRSVLVLTDGAENSSTVYSQNDLLSRATAESFSISAVGLGDNVDEGYLKTFIQSGGWYLYSPTASELRSSFEDMEELLESEHIVTYDSPAGEADGSRRNIRVVLVDSYSGQEVTQSDSAYVSYGVLPNVPGRHFPFFLVLGGLLAAPKLARWGTAIVHSVKFRETYIEIIEAESEHRGCIDPNAGGQGQPFNIGDTVVVCPGCEVPHHVRSWRFNRCRCMVEHHGKGRYCYQRVLPSWLRHWLDRVSGGKTSTTGRRWLCRCEGDDDGY